MMRLLFVMTPLLALSPVSLLQTRESADLSGLSSDERASIESVCLYDKTMVSPAAYNQCVARQVHSLQASGARKPDLSGLSSDERQSIESVCLYDKTMVGPVAYNHCVTKQLRSLQATTARKPDLSGLSSDERQSIESVCLYDKTMMGPAAYAQCVNRQLQSLEASSTHKPDLSGLNFNERQSIESACLYDKTMVGPTAYNQCVERQLRALQVPQTRQTEHPTVFASTQSQAPLPSAQSAGALAQSEVSSKRLQYFVGTWTIEGTIRTSPLGPAGKIRGIHRNEWVSSSFSVASHWDEQRPIGQDSGNAVYAYDSLEKVYTYQGISSAGEKEQSTGTVAGSMWTWISSPTLPSGEILKTRFVIVETSPLSYTFKFEIATQGGEWTSVMDGRATKSQ